jgi:hypothetical protein
MLYALVGAGALAWVTYIEIHAAKSGLKHWQVITLAVIVGVLGPGEIGLRAVGEWLGDVSYATRMELEEPIKACVVGLATMTDIPITKIGITVFVVLRSRLHLWSGVQKRVGRIRLESNPTPTHIVWTKRKGILGECWTQLRDAKLNHPEHFASCMNCTKEEWKALGCEVKMHLTYKDFKQIRSFGFVLASPMTNHKGHYRGCIVVQVPGDCEAALDQTEVLEFIHSSAALTCAVLK